MRHHLGRFHAISFYLMCILRLLHSKKYDNDKKKQKHNKKNILFIECLEMLSWCEIAQNYWIFSV